MSSAEVTQPMGEDGAREAASLGEGVVFGRFLITARVGSGGVGEVFSAYDPRLDRKVALKVLRDGGAGSHTGSASVAGQGLLREAKALAQLTHPNVVTVYEVGEVDGRVFIAMELVDGTDLGAWFSKREHVDWREALELMCQAGEGLAAAHAADAIHRDFKPANVLVGADGRARVGDFGLARLGGGSTTVELDAVADSATIQTMETQAGRLVGTPYFMAPELFDGAPHSVQSDVYAFCVTLFEAVFARRPFAASSILELQVLKCQGVPIVPRGGAVPAALREAIARGLQADPSERFSSMEPLLAVMHEARVPGRGRRWWIAGGVVGLLALGMVASPLDQADPCSGGHTRAAQAWPATRRADVADALEGSAAARASEADVLAQLDDFVDGWEAEHREVCMSARRGERSEQSLDGAMACLERGMIELETFATLLAEGRRDAVLAAASGVDELSEPSSCGRLGRLDGPEPPSAAIVDAVADVDADVARVRATMAAGAYDSALELARDAHEQASKLGYGPLEARATLWLGRALAEAEAPSAASEPLEHALWAGHRTAERDVPALAALELAELCAGSLDRLPAARRFLAYAEAEVERRDLSALRPELERIRAMIARLDRDDAAVIAAHQRALELLSDASGVRRARYLSSYAADLGRLGRIPEAIELLDESLELLEAEVGDSHPLYAEVLGRLGLAYRIAGKLERSKELTERALEIQLQARGPHHAEVAAQRRRLADFYWRTEALTDAIAELERVVEVDEFLFDPPNRHLASDYTELASLYATVQRVDEAAATFEKAVAAYGDDAPADTVADTRCKYGGLLHNLERFDDAAAEVDAGLAMLEGISSAGAVDAMRMCTRARSMVAGSQGDFDLAVQMARRAFSLAESGYGPQDPELLRELLFLAQAHEGAGDVDAAKARIEQGLALPLPESHANLVALAELALARILMAEGQRSRAETLVEGAVQRVRDDGPSAELIKAEASELLGTPHSI